MGFFRLTVVDVSWSPSQIGPVVTGLSHEGVIRLGDVLDLVRRDGSRRPVVLRGIEAVGRIGTPPSAGLMLNLLLGDDLDADDVAVGHVLQAQAPEDGSGVREARRPRPPLLPEVAAGLQMPER